MAQPGPQAPVCVPQGELTITTDMEDLSTALFYDTVPDTWVARAYPSMMGLAAWYADLLLRIRVRTVRGAARPRPQRGPPPRACRNVAPSPRRGREAPAGLAFVRAEPEGPDSRHEDARRCRRFLLLEENGSFQPQSGRSPRSSGRASRPEPLPSAHRLLKRSATPPRPFPTRPLT